MTENADSSVQSAGGSHAETASRSVVTSFTKTATLGLLSLMLASFYPIPLAAAQIPVRFAEGVAHGFLLLRSLDGALLATGDLLQIARGGEVEKRMVFHFMDGSEFEESVVFAEQGVYTMRRHGLTQHGPQLGVFLKLFATLLGRAPPDEHVWIVLDEVPAFVRFERPLYPTGPVRRIELTSPHWPE